MIKNKNKKAQITIFIILALILVVGIIFIFLLRQGSKIEVADEENPQSFIESCTRDAVEEAVSVLSEQGGGIIPEGSTMFKGKNITYLCYNANFYEPCIMQRPDLITHIETEIVSYIKPRVNNCFQVLKAELEPRYEVEIDENWDLTTKLMPNIIEININRDFKMQRGDSVRNFDVFKIKVMHPMYNLAEVAMEIANQEAIYCNFDTLGYMIFYPDYDLDKFRPGKGDVIYQLKHIPTNQRFVFAIRSCALPPGF